MARNEEFAALQKEAMLALVASLAKGFLFDSKNLLWVVDFKMLENKNVKLFNS